MHDPYERQDSFIASPGPKKNNIPPIDFTRNQYGLLNHIDYVFKPDGKIDWLAMLPDEYLVFNRARQEQIEAKYGDKLENLKVKEVEPQFLFVLLSGMRYLADLRGFNSIETSVTSTDDYTAHATCKIHWIGNYETNGRAILITDGAGVNGSSIVPIGKNKIGDPIFYPETIAINRAFVRVVRASLNIPVLGKDEVPTNAKGTESEYTPQFSINSSPIDNLAATMEKYDFSFEKLKKEAVKRKMVDKSFDDIRKFPVGLIYEMITIIKEKSGDAAVL